MPRQRRNPPATHVAEQHEQHDARRAVLWTRQPAGGTVVAVLATVLGVLLCHATLKARVPLLPSGEFDTADAERVLLTLCATGPRTVGSTANERHAVDILQRELEAVREEAAQHGATLEVERQQASGAFYTDFINGFTNAYQNITNLVARLSWPGSTQPGAST